MSTHFRDLSRRWFEEVWNQKRLEIVDELVADDGVGHSEASDASSLPAFKHFHGEFLAAFPDLNVHVEDTISEGDDVVVRWRAEGTHAGEWRGVAATHRPIHIRGITWFRYKNGKLAEAWDHWSPAALMLQLRGEPEAP